MDNNTNGTQTEKKARLFIEQIEKLYLQFGIITPIALSIIFIILTEIFMIGIYISLK